MVRTVIILVVLLLVLGTSSTWALDIAGFGSYALSSNIDDSWGIGAKIDQCFGQSPIFGEFSVSYFPDHKKKIFNTYLELKSLPIDVGLGVKLRNLHLSGGFCYFTLDTNKGDIDDAAGYYLSAGFKTGQPRGGLGIYCGVVYRALTSSVKVRDDSFTVRHKDVELDNVAINLGIVLRL